ncbi:MAG: tail fiber domain-containing protein [Bacteroidia bacterium]
MSIASIALNAQIKIFPGGNLNIGDLGTPVTASKMQVIGNAVFMSSNTAITSAPYIRGYNGYSSSTYPDFTWYGDVSTGIFHPAGNVIGIAIGTFEKFRFNGYGQLLNSNATSSSSTPDYSWNSDANTGMFRPASHAIAFSTNGSERLRINGSGHLTMGTTTDYAMINTSSTDYMGGFYKVSLSSDWSVTSFQVDVNRNNCANYMLTMNGTTNFYVAGAGWIYSQGNYLGSDKNIKDNIATIDSASSKINKIRGVTYKLKKELQNPSYGPASEYMGVIAQEVEAVAPQVVKTFKDGTKGVCYEMLVGLLIQGMKEQNAKIAQMESELNSCCATKSSNRSAGPAQGSTPDPTASSTTGDGGSYVKQNTPNPFNKETSIDYYISEKAAEAGILIFDMNGKLLKTLKLNGRGSGSVSISASDLQPGMYFYSLIVNGKEIDTKKMILTE